MALTSTTHNTAGQGLFLTPNGTGVSISDYQTNGLLHQVTLTLTDVEITTTDAGANGGHGALKIADLPLGYAQFLSAQMDFALVSAETASGLSATATYDIGLGSTTVGTDNAVLATTEEDICDSVTGDLTASAVDIQKVDATALALDGTGTAVDVFLNTAWAADDHGAAAETLTLNGVVRLVFLLIPDYTS